MKSKISVYEPDGQLEVIRIENGFSVFEFQNEKWLCEKKIFPKVEIIECRYRDEIALLGEILDMQFLSYGENSFILDYNGIDNFIAAKNLSFEDRTVRMIARYIANGKGIYIRFGASGADSINERKGGEVVELQSINMKSLGGSFWGRMGFLDETKENKYSTSDDMSNNGFMEEERVVYSHTVWIEKNGGKERGILSKIKIKKDVDLLDEIMSITRKFGILAYGAIIEISGKNVHIKGRVLKHPPKVPMKELQEATDIAVEQEFDLPEKAIFSAYGTQYARYEPEWHQFTGGRQYEKRGHYHGMVVGNHENNIHEVFHLRNLFVGEGAIITIKLYPVKLCAKILPLEKNSDVIASNGKKVNEFISERKEKMRKMIVTDLDGTLLRDDKSISDYTHDYLIRWRKAGNLVVLATARPVRAVKKYVAQELYDAGVYHNGAVVLAGDERLEGVGIVNAQKIALDILNYNRNACVAIEAEDVLYANFNSDRLWPGAGYYYTKDFAELSGKIADKVIVELKSVEEKEEYSSLLPDSLYMSVSENTIGMIMNRNATKTNGIKMLVDKYGINQENVFVFGDDYNDLDMLRNYEHSVAVANGCEEALKTARYVTESNQEDGVVHWIEENCDLETMVD